LPKPIVFMLEDVRFDYIRYANCWEDPALLLSGLQPQKGEKILSIASGGCNCFSLLTTSPELLVAVDVNPIQLFLVELKIEAIRALEREEFMQFVGFLPKKNRWKTYQLIRSRLSSGAQSWWDGQSELIETGIIFGGKFENYFLLFKKWLMPLIHSQATCEALFVSKTAQEQALFYAEKWDNWRWQALFRFFFGKTMMGWLGRDPAFFKHVEGSVGKYILEKTAAHLSTPLAQRNFMLHFCTLGDFGSLPPDYLSIENFPIVRRNLGQIVLQKGFAEEAPNKFGKFDCFNLSNIFEYLDENTVQKVGAGLLAGAKPNARFAYWNLMVPRQLSWYFPEEIRFCVSKSDELTQGDRGFFYNRFVLETVI
jgi:S-adenosylmethionine-diacylglycerol 3-amino-3-carboxypropyl transferase